MTVADYILKIKQTKLAEKPKLLDGADVIDVGCGRKPYADLLCQGGGNYYPFDNDITARCIVIDDVNTGIWEHDGEWDVVFIGDVLEHCPDPLFVLKEAHRVLRHGGLLLMFTPFQWRQHRGRGDDLPELPTDYWRFAPKGLAKLGVDAGFVKVHSCPIAGSAESLVLNIINFAGVKTGWASVGFALGWPWLKLARLFDKAFPNYSHTIGYFTIANKI